jgi:hypothetical protein
MADQDQSIRRRNVSGTGSRASGERRKSAGGAGEVSPGVKGKTKDDSSDSEEEEVYDAEKDPDEVDLYSTNARERRKQKVRARLPFFKRLGATLESSEVQVIIVLLIIIDMVVALVQMFSSMGKISFLMGADSVHRFMEYGSVFATIIFLFEILLAFVAFGFRTLSHPGYVVDVGVVGTQLFMSAVHESIAVRLLGLFRFWRVVRLMRDMVAQIEEAHSETIGLLEEERDRNDDLLAQLRAKNNDLRREVDRRTRVQEMLKSYKEEVETLQEALFIAAQTTATDAANMLPPETIESLTTQYASAAADKAAARRDRGRTVRPTNLVVDEDGEFREGAGD